MVMSFLVPDSQLSSTWTKLLSGNFPPTSSLHFQTNQLAAVELQLPSLLFHLSHPQGDRPRQDLLGEVFSEVQVDSGYLAQVLWTQPITGF